MKGPGCDERDQFVDRFSRVACHISGAAHVRGILYESLLKYGPAESGSHFSSRGRIWPTGCRKHSQSVSAVDEKVGSSWKNQSLGGNML